MPYTVKERKAKCLILKELTIEQFGEIEHFDVLFHEQVTAITVPDTENIVKAIGLTTNNKSLIDCSEAFAVSDNTEIILKLEIAGHPYTITARGQPHSSACIYEATDCKTNAPVDVSLIFRNMRLCEEEEDLIYYRYDPKNAFSNRLLHYKDPEKYYALEDFQKKTNGSGSTQTFRTYLKKFIQKYGTYNSFTDSYKTELCSDGSFVRCCPTPTIFIADPDERKKKLFDYDCYIEVNKFWCGFEDIRDINNEKWPMLINAGDLNEYIGFHKLLVKSKGLGKQMIIMNR